MYELSKKVKIEDFVTAFEEALDSDSPTLVDDKTGEELIFSSIECNIWIAKTAFNSYMEHIKKNYEKRGFDKGYAEGYNDGYEALNHANDCML